MTARVYRNGELVDESFLSERAFVYADGVFESMRSRGKVIPLWSYHRKRLQLAAETLFLNIDFQLLEAQINTVLSANAFAHARVKLIIGRAHSARGSYLPTQSSVNIFIFISELNSAPNNESVELVCAQSRLPLAASFSGLKLINRLDYIVASVGSKLTTGQELLFLNSADHVIETMHHNIFLLQGNTLVTPSLEDFGVRGVFREYIKNELALSESLNIEEREVDYAELLQSDAIFITNAVSGIVNVHALGEKNFVQSNKVMRMQTAAAALYQ